GVGGQLGGTREVDLGAGSRRGDELCREGAGRIRTSLGGRDLDGVGIVDALVDLFVAEGGEDDAATVIRDGVEAVIAFAIARYVGTERTADRVGLAVGKDGDGSAGRVRSKGRVAREDGVREVCRLASGNGSFEAG